MKLDFLSQIKLAGLPRPMPEFRFHPVRRWLADWAWPEHRLIVEIEGGAFSRGRHVRGKGFLGDMAKYNEMTLLGYSLLRFTPDDVSKGVAVRVIQTWFEMHERFGI